MAKQRFLSLDVMRGVTLALMILVNTPGSWSAVYAPLLHADWHGATPTDYIFPFFLFIVGSALFFSSRSQSQPVSAQLLRIFRRSALIFLIGVLLNAYPFTTSLSEVRIPGVLQRIALAYLLAAPIALFLSGLWRTLAMAVLLLGYWAVLQISHDPYSLLHSVVRQLDLWVFGAGHIWQGKGVAFDPEGLLSTLPSVVTVLLGFEATRVLCSTEPSQQQKIRLQLLACGIALILLALLWHPFFPINKYLWTSSFVLITGGAAILALVLLVALEPLKPLQPAYQACAILGQNPLFIYVLSIVWAKTLYLIPIGNISSYQWSFELLSTFLSAKNASLLFALINVTIMWLIAWWLHRRKIIISI